MDNYLIRSRLEQFTTHMAMTIFRSTFRERSLRQAVLDAMNDRITTRLIGLSVSGVFFAMLALNALAG